MKIIFDEEREKFNTVVEFRFIKEHKELFENLLNLVSSIKKVKRK